MSLFTKLILWFKIPALPILEAPAPKPIRVVVDELPEIIQFITLMLVTESPRDVVPNQTTAELVPVFVLEIVKSRVAEEAGHTEFTVVPILPSIVT